MKDFCLKNERKIILTNEGNQEGVYPEKSIKEFIKILKEEMCRCGTMTFGLKKCYACRNIDKRAGDL